MGVMKLRNNWKMQPVFKSNVNHPSHYQTESGLEAIDVIEAFFHDNFHLGNAVKYLLRAGKKGDTVEDLDKAVWYIERYKKRIGESNDTT